MAKYRPVLTFLAVCLLPGCATEEPPADVFKRLVEPFALEAVSKMPVQATLAGYHRYEVPAEQEGQPPQVTELDPLLDDYSAGAIQERIQFQKDFLDTLHQQVDRDRLAGVDFADYGVVEEHVATFLYEYEFDRVHEHNPNLYIRTLGLGLYGPMVLEYAPESERLGHIVSRLQQAPEFFQNATSNLAASSEIELEVAGESADGLIHLIQNRIPEELATDSNPGYEAAAEAAVAAIEEFKNHLESLAESPSNWRLGSQGYERKFKAFLGTDLAPGDVLAMAENEFQGAREQMMEIGRQVHIKIYGRGQQPRNEAVLMEDVWDVVADENRLRSPGNLLDEVKKDLDELRKFVQEEGLVGQPRLDNLEVVETPRFMRGIVTRAKLLPAPSLRSDLGAHYWVTPISGRLSRRALRSKLREYNDFSLKLLSLREAIPGRHVQRDYASKVRPEGRNLLRNVFEDESYVKGWISYITETTVGSGLMAGSDEFQFSWRKYRLSLLADAIIDIRMHTTDMSEEDALDFLRNQAFYESEEARETLQTVKLSPGELPSYYFGWKEWLRVRDHYQQEKMDYSPSSFHNKALSAGPMPMPSLGYVLAERPMEPR